MAEYDERQKDFFQRNPHVRERLTVEQLEAGRNMLVRLWEDTMLATAGGVSFVCSGTLVNVFDMAIAEARRDNEPIDLTLTQRGQMECRIPITS